MKPPKALVLVHYASGLFGIIVLVLAALYVQEGRYHYAIADILISLVNLHTYKKTKRDLEQWNS